MRQSLVQGLSGAVMVVVVAGSIATAATTKPAATAAPKPSAAQVAAGKKAFVASGCQGCHKVAGTGGTSGPDLSKVGKEHDAAWLTKKVKDPKATKKDSFMPAFAGSATDLKNVVAYLTTLK
jgi:mono/diheme cytochrome c family protein